MLDVGRLFLVSALWGTSFLCNAIALNDFAPLAIAAWRVALATVFILMVCHLKSLRIPTDATSLLLFTAIGLFNSAVPFSLIGWGQQTVDPATAAILIAASPFATLLLSHLMTRDDRFTARKLFGLLFGFSGVLLLFGRGLAVDSNALTGMMMIMLAAWCYALSALFIRRLGPIPSLVIVAGSLCFSAVCLLPLAIFMHPPWQQIASADSWMALLFLAAGPTAAAYVLRTQIVQLNGAVFMSNAGYLIPLFAVFWAWLFLSQRPSLDAWLAMLLIFSGLAIGRQKG